MAYVNLYSIPEMDMSYQHAPDFGTPGQQNDWFAARRKQRLTDMKIHITPSRTTVTIPWSYRQVELEGIDYCSLYPEGEYEMLGDKIKFYFVADYEYVSEHSTRLVLVLDVLQTFMFDIEFKDSYVERAHVDRWKNGMPTREYVQEGLDFGEHIVLSNRTRNITTFKDRFLIVASSPLGITNKTNKKNEIYPEGQGGDTDPDSNCGNWEQGIISTQGFRFIKGQEAWSPYHHSVWGQNVIAYGITPDGERDVYNMLASKEPLDEEYGAKVNYETINRVYGNGKNFGKHTVEYFKTEFHVDNQHKFDALIDLFYNTGQGSLIKGSLHDVLQKYPNDESKVRPIWEKHWTSGSDHLRKRRKAECDIYFGKGYKMDPINVYNAKGVITGQLKGDGWLPTCGSDPGGETFEAEGYKWQFPVRGKKSVVTSDYGWRIINGKRQFHKGIDIGSYGAVSLPIYATRDGEVVFAGWDTSGAGNLVTIRHTDISYQTKYMHNRVVNVKVGQKVKAGDIIAYMGTTGNSSGVHLHYQLEAAPYGGANRVDPMPFASKGTVM